MFCWINKKILSNKFKRKFKHFNKYTKKAFKINDDKQFEDLCWQCINDVAKQHNKNWKSFNLEDVYQVLSTIRNKTPEVLRKITLEQIIKTANMVDKGSIILNLIYGITKLNPVPLAYVALKPIFGKKIGYVFKIYIVSIILEELYTTKDTHTVQGHGT